jgi:hypothetical protein
MERTDRDFVNQLFRGLQAIFPAWRQAFDSDEAVAEAKRQWTVGLVEAGLTSADAIKAGLSRARRSKNPFIPSIGQFIEWCERAYTESLGLPTDDAAYLQIQNYLLDSRGCPSHREPTQAHPAVYWAYQNIDDHHWWKCAANSQENRKAFLEKYQVAREKALHGFDFPAPPMLLQQTREPERERTPEEKERTRLMITEMKKQFRGGA